MVVLRQLERSKATSGGFIIPDEVLANRRIAFCRVEAVGSIAEKKTKLKPGDFVYADHLASHYQTSPVCVMKWDNVLLLTNAEKSELKALPGWALMSLTEEMTTKFIANVAKLRHGIIKSINYGDIPEWEEPFKEGDDVIVTKACDVYDGIADTTLVAMRIPELVAKFVKS